MCGISGIISKKNRPVTSAEIRRITELVAHRGPDGEGYYFGPNFAFGHRRLSILDLSNHGHQPMVYRRRYWITYNGEIYNYLELRAELEKFGHEFTSDSDTEVILAAYAQWGGGCCTHFNGMWALAIYDAVEEKIFLARDRFGVKPLYYCNSPSEFVFGSEIKQLLAVQPEVRANRRVVI
jgi:asparagine synthase (glutamine-hydrolysing)